MLVPQVGVEEGRVPLLEVDRPVAEDADDGVQLHLGVGCSGLGEVLSAWQKKLE